MWLLVVLCTSLLFLQWLGLFTHTNTTHAKSLEIQRNAIMRMDSLVKNHSAEQPADGAAAWSGLRHRATSNNMEKSLLQAVGHLQEAEPTSVFFQELMLIDENGVLEKLLETPRSENCLLVERLVVIESKAFLLKGTVCHA